MLSTFNKPYPFNDDLKYNSKIIFFASVGVFVFLFLFQPFNIGILPIKERYYLMVSFAVVTFLSLSFNLLIIPSLFSSKISAFNWNIKKEILWDLWILFFTLVSYFLLNNFFGVTKFEYNNILKLILIAVVPISILIILNHNKILRTRLRLANELSKKLKDHKSINDRIVYFKSDYQKDSVAIKINTLILIRSANNYIELFWKNNDRISNQMVRCSMTYAEEILKDFKFIFKCHRSFVININYIDKIEGSVQGYKLFFENIDFAVPVSKNSAIKLKELI